MSFIHKHSKKIHYAGMIVVLLMSYIKTFYAQAQYAIPIMVIPAWMLLFGIIAGRAGSLMAGITGTIIVWLVF